MDIYLKYHISETDNFKRMDFFSAKLLHAKPKHASGEGVINEGVSRREEKSLVPIPYCNSTSWFAMALAEIRLEGF